MYFITAASQYLRQLTVCNYPNAPPLPPPSPVHRTLPPRQTRGRVFGAYFILCKRYLKINQFNRLLLNLHLLMYVALVSYKLFFSIFSLSLSLSLSLVLVLVRSLAFATTRPSLANVHKHVERSLGHAVTVSILSFRCVDVCFS